MRRTMALDRSVQGIECPFTEIFLAINGQFHQKIVGICFTADVICSPDKLVLDWRFEY
jgi:hypothetical protein